MVAWVNQHRSTPRERLIKYRGSRLEPGTEPPAVEEIRIDPQQGYELHPGEVVLGCTLERIRIPNGYQGFIETKGDTARTELQVHNGDGHTDPGSDHVLTLEITNLNSIPVPLYLGLFICQLFMHQLSSPCLREYRGQQGPTIYRPSWGRAPSSQHAAFLVPAPATVH